MDTLKLFPVFHSTIPFHCSRQLHVSVAAAEFFYTIIWNQWNGIVEWNTGNNFNCGLGYFPALQILLDVV